MKDTVSLRTRFLHWIREHGTLLLSAVIVLGCWCMLEFSCILTLDQLYDFLYLFDIRFALLNCLTLGILWSLFLILFRRMWLADLLCTILCGGIAIANHYVIAFHSMPLSFLLLRNFTTAMNVISGYQFEIGFSVAFLMLSIVVLAVFCFFVRRWEKKQTPMSLRKQLIRDLSLVLASFCVLYFGYFSANPLKPRKTIAWQWNEAYYTHGYLACSIETLCQLYDTVNRPDGYSQEHVQTIEIDYPEQNAGATPDIILILNETFYDLQQITDVQADVNYLENIQNMDNLLSGYAVVPGAGGSTNSAEYELLTSNSLNLMPGVTPFNTLDLRDSNSMVSHLSSLGYSTLACHPSPSANYSRVLAYPHLGFQTTYFQDDFADCTFYASRPYETDASVYSNLIRWYEEAPADQPRFLYALTLQNHGNWDMNESDQDLVHTANDYGETTRLVNEYLSCVSLSDQAFKDLTDYFSQSDRPVIICMVGDHAPSFASSITDAQYSSDEKALLLRKVPLLIWANFALPQAELGTMSMNFVVPTLLELADVTLSPYYSYILQLKQEVPIVASYGSYYDAEGNLYKYDSDDGAPYEGAVDNYFYLEYNNLQEERMQYLFDPIP